MGGFIKFDGIDGETLDQRHQKWTELETIRWGVSKPSVSAATGVIRRRGDTTIHDIAIRKLIDKSSPKLFAAVVSGKVFKKVEIDMTATYTNGGREPYLHLELENVHITSIDSKGAAQPGASAANGYNDITSIDSKGDAQPEKPAVEELALNFEKIRYTYFQNDENGHKFGTVEVTWNVPAGKS